MLEVHAILHRQRCYENMTKKTGTLSDAYFLLFGVGYLSLFSDSGNGSRFFLPKC